MNTGKHIKGKQALSQEGKRSRRHCMLVHAYYPIGETRVERQAHALLDSGIEVDVICLGGSRQYKCVVIDGVTVHRLPVARHASRGTAVQMFEYLAFFAMAMFWLGRLHLKRRYDTVQVHNLPDFLVFAALMPKLAGARVLLDLHDLMPEFYAERFEASIDSPLVRLIRWQEWLSCRFADQVITVTELWRQSLIARGQPADKVAVVMNVADERVFNRSALDDGHGDEKKGGNGRFQLIYHGIMDYRHGLDLLLRAVDTLRQEAPDLRLLLHGHGRALPALQSLVQELDLEDRVEFSQNYVATEDLPALLSRANLAVVPYREGIFTSGILPTKLMEYAALGIPAIASRTPAIAAYFDDTNVQFFTPDDASELATCILSLYRDRDHLERLARNVIEFNQRYSWSEQRSGYVALVKRLARAS